MKENQSKNRALVFIDGNNFYFKLKDMISSKTEVFKLLDFNYNSFSKNLIRDNNFNFPKDLFTKM